MGRWSHQWYKVLFACLALRFAHSQEGAAAFMSSREAQQAAQAVQDAARHFEQTTQSMLSTPEAKRTASSIEAAATAVHDGTANFVQSGQAAETATAVGNAAGTLLAAGAKATTAGSRALQRAVGALVVDMSAGVPTGSEVTIGGTGSVIAAPAPGSHRNLAGRPHLSHDDANDGLAAASPTAENSGDRGEDLEPVGTRTTMLSDSGELLPRQVTGMRSLAATRSGGGETGGIDGLQLLQGLQAVVSTAAQVAQAARASGVAVGAPSGSPLAALDAMAQTALNSPLFNGQSGQGQALLVLPQAPTEALPPGVDAQSAQRVRLAAQGAINSLTISKSPNQQSVLAQLSNAVQQQKRPEDIAREGVNDIVTNRAGDFLGALVGTSPPPPPPPASLQDTIANVVSGLATQVQRSGFLENVASTLSGQSATQSSASPARTQGHSFVQLADSASVEPTEPTTDPIVDKGGLAVAGVIYAGRRVDLNRGY